MCGICGIAGPEASSLAAAVDAMNVRLAHRGPDGQGRYIAPSGQAVLGHRRLAVIDVTDSSAQPMLTADGKRALAYNGELYNFRELREDLRCEGVEFRTLGDTEVVLQALVRWGDAALPRFNGMFALAYWDDERRTLLLARDRFGQKPLYLARQGESRLFASELRALLATRLVERRIDLDGLAGFLCYGSVPGPGTLVRGIRSLEPGHCLLWTPGGAEAVRDYAVPRRESREISAEELREELRLAVQRHLVSDVPIGVFLSGGLDSASIAALAAKSSNSRIATFTLAFRGEAEQDESGEARATAQHVGTAHTEIDVSSDWVRQHLDPALASLDQPSGDGLNTWLVAKAARQAGLTVALSGLGSDELFGGYGTFIDIPRLARLRRSSGPVSGLVAGAAGLIGGTSPRRAGRIADLMSAPAGVLEAYLVRRRVLSSAQLRQLVPGLGLQGWIPGITETRRARLAEAIEGLAPEDAVSRLELALYLADTLLRDSDVMGMAHALEIRAPFLDDRFASVALALPASSRRHRPRPKSALFEAIGPLLPPGLASRPKRGFTLPLAAWMLGDLSGTVEAGIEQFAAMGDPVSKESVRALWRDFRKRPTDIGWYRPWMLFVLGRYLTTNGLRPS